MRALRRQVAVAQSTILIDWRYTPDEVNRLLRFRVVFSQSPYRLREPLSKIYNTMSKPTVANAKSMIAELTAGKTYYFCTCGKSAKQPFCDGAHKGTNFSPLSFVAEKDGPAHLCGCKQSSNAPFCDGSHKQIPADKLGQEFSLRGEATEADEG